MAQWELVTAIFIRERSAAKYSVAARHDKMIIEACKADQQSLPVVKSVYA